MKECMLKYYASEFNGAIAGGIIGVTLLLSTFLLWRVSDDYSMGQGISYVFFCAGLFFIILCTVVAIRNRNKMEESFKVNSKDNITLQRAEIVRMEKVLDSAYTSGFILFSILVVLGLLLALIVQESFVLKGMGVGMLIVGVVGYCTEALSVKRNKAYLYEIRSQSFS